ncbi:hypothetical protein [Spongorhabdus nitratireducens]
MKIIKLMATMLVLTSTVVQAESGASDQSATASRHSALAAYHGTSATVKVGSAVSAVPLVVVGGTSQASTQAGTAMIEFATQPAELPVTEKTITAAPSPLQMMKQQDAAQ